MSSLVESILSIERQANDLVAQAHEQATAIEKDTSAKIETIREEIAAATNDRLAKFRSEAERRHEQAKKEADEDHHSAFSALEAIDPLVIKGLAKRVVARFGEV